MSCFRKSMSMFLVLRYLTYNFVGHDRGQTSVEITTRWSENIYIRKDSNVRYRSFVISVSPPNPAPYEVFYLNLHKTFLMQY